MSVLIHSLSWVYSWKHVIWKIALDSDTYSACSSTGCSSAGCSSAGVSSAGWSLTPYIESQVLIAADPGWSPNLWSFATSSPFLYLSRSCLLSGLHTVKRRPLVSKERHMFNFKYRIIYRYHLFIACVCMSWICPWFTYPQTAWRWGSKLVGCRRDDLLGSDAFKIQIIVKSPS